MKQDMKALGQRGGLATREKHGAEHYQRIGLMGGEAVRAQLSPERLAEIGRLGGLAAMSRAGHAAAAGRKGGAATRERHDGEHFKAIGRRGAQLQKQRKLAAADLRAALSPFRSWLEQQHQHLELGGAGAEALTPIPPTTITLGNCSRLLAALKHALALELGEVAP